MRPEYRLMSLVALLLLFRIEEVSLRVHIKNEVFVALLTGALLNFIHFALCLLLQLVMQGHKQVALPNAELGLQGIVLTHS